MTLTKKRIENLFRFNSEGCDCQANAEEWEVHELARMALTALESRADAEPVAYMYKDNLHTDARFSLHTRFGNWSKEDINEYGIIEIPLYTRPQPAPVVPDDVAFEKWWEDERYDEKLKNVQGVMFNRVKNAAFRAWSAASRSAMLQGKAEPVSQPYTLPDGYALVPVEPTQEMLTASYMFARVDNTVDSWKAMLAAAPRPDVK